MTARVPQGAVGEVVVLPARGRKPRGHVSAGAYGQALEWLMLLRRYQAQGYTFDEALEQANAAFEPQPPGRAQQKGALR